VCRYQDGVCGAKPLARRGKIYIFTCLHIVSGDLFLLVFSMDLRESFEEVIRLREQILETKMSATANSSGGRRSRVPHLRVPMVIVGNKCDKEMR